MIFDRKPKLFSEEDYKEKVRAAYDQLAEAYDRHIDHKPHNALYDRPNTLGLIDISLEGADVLDAACGSGKYAEIILEAGASVTGFDLSPEMIRLAQKRTKGQGRFFVHDLGKPCPDLSSSSFDLVICALALHYLSDWATALETFYRCLMPQGRLIISIEHPFFDYQYFNSKAYFDKEYVQATWTGFGPKIEMHGYRRSLQDTIQPIIQAGFRLDAFLEPKPVPAFKEADPKHYKELMSFPAFLCMRAIKD